MNLLEWMDKSFLPQISSQQFCHNDWLEIQLNVCRTYTCHRKREFWIMRTLFTSIRLFTLDLMDWVLPLRALANYPEVLRTGHDLFSFTLEITRRSDRQWYFNPRPFFISWIIEQVYCIKLCMILGNSQVETVQKIQQAFCAHDIGNTNKRTVQFMRTSVKVPGHNVMIIISDQACILSLEDWCL